jgi:hypothetical protein
MTERQIAAFVPGCGNREEDEEDDDEEEEEEEEEEDDDDDARVENRMLLGADSESVSTANAPAAAAVAGVLR